MAVVPAGATIDDLVEKIVPPDHEAIVIMDGKVVCRSAWPDLCVTDDSVLQVRVMLRGGGDGSNPIATVLSIAVLIAAPYAAGALLPATASVALGNATTAVIGAGGVQIVNMLFPPRLPTDSTAAAGGQTDRLYTLSGGGNRARPHEPLLLLLGRHRVFPDLAAKEYAEFSSASPTPTVGRNPVWAFGGGNNDAFNAEYGGYFDGGYAEREQSAYYTAGGVKMYNEQFLFQLFDFGIGNLSTSNPQFGETPLVQFEEVYTQTGESISLVVGNVDTHAGGDLEYNNPLSRRTADHTTKIVFHIVSQNFEVNNSGTAIGGTNVFTLEWIQVGANTWTSKSVRMRSPSGNEARNPVRRAFSYTVPEGQYDVRVTLVTRWEDTNTRLTANASLYSINAHQPQTANFSGRNPYAIKIRATGQLYGRIENFSADVAQLIPVWNGSAWEDDQETSNPAWILRKFWQGWRRPSDNRLLAGRGLTDDQIDDASLKAWGRFCENNGLECNVVIDASARDTEIENLIAQCGWASVSKSSGRRGVIWENDDQPVTAIYTPSNIVAGSMEVEYENEGLADEIVGTFLDSESDYSQNTIRRTVPGIGTPERPVTVPLRGITRGEQAAKEVNRMAAAQFYHTRTIIWEVGPDGGPIFVTRGDVVGMGHDLVGGTMGGRLTSIDSERTTVETSVDIPNTGTIWIWDLNGDVHATAYTTAGSQILLNVALTSSPANITDDPLSYRFTAFDSSADPVKVRITGVEHAVGGVFRLTARDEVQDYYDARVSDLSYQLLPDRSRYRPVDTTREDIEIGEQKWYSGVTVPPPTLGNDGDFFLKKDNNTVYEKRGGLWSLIVDFVGADGSTWHSGSGPPDENLGSEGDYYFQTSDASIWRKLTTWSKLIDIDGDDGSTWHSDAGPPDPNLGKVNDFYFRNDNGWVYEKTDVKTWTFQRDITGEDGESISISTILIQDDGARSIFFSDGTSITIPAGATGIGINAVSRNSETGLITLTLDDGSVREYTSADGVDGAGIEYIYTRTTTNGRPSTPTGSTNIDEDVPTGWTDEPVGTDSTNRYEWEAVRKGTTQQWEAFSLPALHSRYVEEITNTIGQQLQWEVGESYGLDTTVFIFRNLSLGGETVGLPVFYTCILAHTSAESNKPPNATYWSPGVGINAPTVPQNFTLTAQSPSRIDMSWDAPAQGSQPITYRIECATNSAFTEGFYVLAEAQTGTNYFDTSLSGSTLYYYRVRAMNAGGNSNYATGSVTTPASVVAPSAVQNLAAAAVSSSQIDLSWDAPSTGTTPFTYRVERAANTTFTLNFVVVSTSVSGTSLGNAGISANTTYYYRVRAENTAGNGPYTSTSATTQTPVVTPSAVRNLAVAAVSSSQIFLSWDAPSTGTTPFTYRVERATDSAFTQGLTTVNASVSATSLWNGGISANTTYYYRVRAENTAGNGPYTSTTATTQTPVVAPSAVRNLAASAVSASQIDLSWDAPSAGTTPFTYRVERATDSAFTQGLTTVNASVSGTSLGNAGISANTTYYYRVRAENTAGNGPYASTSATTQTPVVTPSAVRNLAAAAVSSSQIDLSWDAPATGTTPFTYRVERATDSAFTQGLTTVHASVSGTSLANAGISANTTYYYRVRAENTAGNGPYVSTSATTQTPVVAPSAVRNLAASAVSSSQIDLSWDAPSTGTTPFTYRVERATDSAFTQGLTTVNASLSGTSLANGGISANTTYYYRVRAENTAGNGPYSTTVNATTQMTPVAPSAVRNLQTLGQSESQIVLYWSPPDTGSTPFTYRVERASDSNFTVNFLTLSTSVNVQGYVDLAGFTTGATYYYRVRAMNTAGDGPYQTISVTLSA